jgi:beta-lactamase superfamily II metal-dependent hydrolase
VDTVIVSHANYDHFGATAEVVGAYAVREVLTGPQFARHAAGNPPAESMLRALGDLQRPPRLLEPGQRLPLGRDTAVEVLWPPPDAPGDLAANDVSLVLRLTHAGRAVLFTGDIQDPAMRELMATYGRPPARRRARGPRTTAAARRAPPRSSTRSIRR